MFSISEHNLIKKRKCVSPDSSAWKSNMLNRLKKSLGVILYKGISKTDRVSKYRSAFIDTTSFFASPTDCVSSQSKALQFLLLKTIGQTASAAWSIWRGAMLCAPLACKMGSLDLHQLVDNNAGTTSKENSSLLCAERELFSGALGFPP